MGILRNIFKKKTLYPFSGYGNYYNPSKIPLTINAERTIVNSIFNRIAIDVSLIDLKHVKEDENGRLLEVVNSNLNKRLMISSNIDQTPKQFIQDLTMSLLDEGYVAVVPVDIEKINNELSGVNSKSLRVGKIIEWFPTSIKVDLYNEENGEIEEIIISKSDCAIIESPLYSVINEPNSTVKRLTRKLSLIDQTDEKVNSGKLDLIIQLPYTLKSEIRKREAELRRNDIEQQLSNSTHGIVFSEGTEKITQLNRPVENNLLSQIQYLTDTVYSQLGLTTGVMDGTANDSTLLNYMNRTMAPILSAIADEFTRKFLSEEAISNGERITFYLDPFKLISINKFADIADKLTRNEILSSNEVRQIIGIKPHDDPNADKLINKNIKNKEGGRSNEKQDI